MALALLYLTLLAYCLAAGNWNDFSGSFQMTGLAGGTGYVTGNMVWSWTNSQMFLNFNTGTSSTWQETYTFNTTRGYPAAAGQTADPPQYYFTLGSACSPTCNTASSQSGLPLLNPSGPYLTPSGSANCLTYTPNTVTNSLLSSMTASNSQLCTFTLVDGRTFTMTSFNPTPSSITLPSGCQCTQAVDIQFLIDHSGSIDDSEMKQFKNFVTNFLAGLTISPTQVNVGMTYFSVPAQSGTNWAMTGDINVVNAGMAGWAVPCVQGSLQCQGGGTATPTGLELAGRGLYASSRKVPKILITLTDGATNVGLNGKTCCASSGADEYSGCNADIQTAMNYVKAIKAQQTYTHNLTFISAGIGTECGTNQKSQCNPYCKYTPHLVRFADGITSNVLSVNDWNALQSQVSNLRALTCVTSNNVAQATCLNTCNGLCVCGGCSPPTGCRNTNCFNYTLAAGSCQATPNPCPAQPCTISTCDTTLNGGLGGCRYTPTSCAGITSGCNNCVQYTCATTGNSVGTCSVPDTSNCQPPVDCVQSDWGGWSTCTATCGGGTTTGTRSITTATANCGAGCGPASQIVPCNTQGCPVNCTVSSWSGFSPCTVTCNGGTQYQNRTIITQPANGGASCPPLSNTVTCNTNGCPVDCVWSPWSAFTPCSVTCGGGTQNQTRYIQTQAANGGADCDGQDSNSTSCNTNGCPVDCVWGPWSDYTDCTTTCGGGTQTKNRTQTTVAANGGRDCDGGNTFIQTCNSQSCACIGSWSAWTTCLCTNSLKNRTYTIIANGTGCDQVNGYVDVTGCTPQGCPVPCNGAWGAWSSCSCASGTISRTFTVYTPSQNNGTNCTNSTGDVDTQTCDTSACPVACVGSWGSWSLCSCTTDSQSRNYTITTPAANGGAPCPGNQTQSCVPQDCPVDCIGTWSEWGFCPCKGYSTSSTQNRTYVITTPAQFDGVPCNQSAPANRSCTAINCPIDCVGQWGSWSLCACANNTQTRTFVTTVNQSNGGLFCVATNGDNVTQGCDPVGCIDYGPKCDGPDDNVSCVDSSLCTVNECVLRADGLYHCDWSTPVNCDDDSVCTTDSCDETKGCQHIDLVCTDGNACTNDFCDPVKGCYHVNITCSVNASDFCFEPICDPITGCGSQQRTCPGSSEDNCTLIICHPEASSNDTACQATQLCGFSPIIIGVLAGGAIAGIVVACAFVALFLLSGATYAIAQQTGSEAGHTVNHSPLYVGDGTSGTNVVQ